MITTLPSALPLADVRERLGHLIQPNTRSMWIRTDPSTQHCASCANCSGPCFTASSPRCRRGERADRRADRQHAQQRAHGAADDQVGATGRERAAIGEHRTAGDEVDDEVVRCRRG